MNDESVERGEISIEDMADGDQLIRDWLKSKTAKGHQLDLAEPFYIDPD